jgi:hypothetical protein
MSTITYSQYLWPWLVFTVEADCVLYELSPEIEEKNLKQAHSVLWMYEVRLK